MADIELEDDEIEYEADLSRELIADHLESFATELRAGDRIELDVADRTVVVKPPETIAFEVEIEDEAEADGSVERSVEFELEWIRQEDEDPLPDPEELEE